MALPIVDKLRSMCGELTNDTESTTDGESLGSVTASPERGPSLPSSEEESPSEFDVLNDREKEIRNVFAEYDLVAEKILGRKRINGIQMYKVQWKGLPEEMDWPLVTWEPVEELECVNLILKFEAQRKQKVFLPDDHPEMDVNKRKTRETQPRPRERRETRSSIRRTLNQSSLLATRASPPNPRWRNPRLLTVTIGGRSLNYVPVFNAVVVDGRRLRGETMEQRVLLHGTQWKYATSIFQEGFRLPVQQRSGHSLGATWPHLFGHGIYFTTSLEKASHFGDTILVCEVLTGKTKTMSGADYEVTFENLRASGYDSVYAPPGCGGNVFDEHVVYTPAQVRVMGYLSR